MPAKRKTPAIAQSEEKNIEEKASKPTKQKKPKDKVDDEIASKKGKVEKKGKKAAGSKNEEVDDVEENLEAGSNEELTSEVADEPKGKQKKAKAGKDAPEKKGKKTKNQNVDWENVRVTRNQSKKTRAANFLIDHQLHLESVTGAKMGKLLIICLGVLIVEATGLTIPDEDNIGILNALPFKNFLNIFQRNNGPLSLRDFSGSKSSSFSSGGQSKSSSVAFTRPSNTLFDGLLFNRNNVAFSQSKATASSGGGQSFSTSGSFSLTENPNNYRALIDVRYGERDKNPWFVTKSQSESSSGSSVESERNFASSQSGAVSGNLKFDLSGVGFADPSKQAGSFSASTSESNGAFSSSQAGSSGSNNPNVGSFAVSSSGSISNGFGNNLNGAFSSSHAGPLDAGGQNGRGFGPSNDVDAFSSSHSSSLGLNVAGTNSGATNQFSTFSSSQAGSLGSNKGNFIDSNSGSINGFGSNLNGAFSNSHAGSQSFNPNGNNLNGAFTVTQAGSLEPNNENGGSFASSSSASSGTGSAPSNAQTPGTSGSINQNGENFVDTNSGSTNHFGALGHSQSQNFASTNNGFDPFSTSQVGTLPPHNVNGGNFAASSSASNIGFGATDSSGSNNQNQENFAGISNESGAVSSSQAGSLEPHNVNGITPISGISNESGAFSISQAGSLVSTNQNQLNVAGSLSQNFGDNQEAVVSSSQAGSSSFNNLDTASLSASMAHSALASADVSKSLLNNLFLNGGKSYSEFTSTNGNLPLNSVPDHMHSILFTPHHTFSDDETISSTLPRHEYINFKKHNSNTFSSSNSESYTGSSKSESLIGGNVAFSNSQSFRSPKTESLFGENIAFSNSQSSSSSSSGSSFSESQSQSVTNSF
ncbi:hypothetical protein FQR65_LT14272 [Abscondita terminalis]|nr:hypothetical protein FQR65_LT14272 [Abscondita terminalis]